jgi:copper(I)-binding protein
MRLTLLLPGLLLASCSKAPSEQPQIAVSAAWARPTTASQSTAAAYFTIANAGGADRLTRVAADIGQASLHSTSLAGGVMRMRPVEALDLPAGETVELKPGGVHVMITGVKQPLPAGSRFPLRLTFESSGERSVAIAVRAERPAQ